MFIYILLNGGCKKTAQVSLNLEKCMPGIGTYTEGRMDPALWYKALVIDSIIVDCDRRAVFWSCDKCNVDIKRECSEEDGFDPEEAREFCKYKERMLNEYTCVELGHTRDEMYVKFENIFNQLSPDLLDRECNVSTYKDILEMLHVCILPHIQFQPKHQTLVKDVLETIVKRYENVVILLKMNVQSRNKIEKSLRRQRRSLLVENSVSIILNNSLKDDELISLLLKHAQKDIRELEDTLSILTDRITPLTNAKDETSVSLLAYIRAEMDEVLMKKERIIAAREEMMNGLILHTHTVTRNNPKNRLKRLQPIRESRMTDRFEKYERETIEVENLSNIKQQISIKMRLSSVLKATSLTLKEIQVDESSFGYNRRKVFLEFEADLSDPTRKSDYWAAVNEQVKTYLHTNQLDFNKKHDEFCTRFKEKCKAIQERAKRDLLIKFGSYRAGRLPVSFGSNRSHQEKAARCIFGSVDKDDCETLCKQLSDHIISMADAISIEMQGNDASLKTVRSKVYICYEKHIAEELLPVLCKLLELSHTVRCEKLSAWIEQYAETELASINNNLKSLFLQSLFLDVTNREICNKKDARRSTCFTESLVERCNGKSSSLSETVDRTRSSLLHLDRGEFSDATPKTTLQTLNTEITSTFERFYAAIQEEDAAVSIFSKLRHLTRAVQSAENTFSELRAKTNQSSEICTDDIFDILILLICRLGPGRLLKLYAHLNLILHTSPYILQGSINEYSLVSLSGAFQHLFERQEMHDDSVQKRKEKLLQA